MQIGLFEITNGVVLPNEACYTIPWLKAIIDAYPENYLQIYAYLFYMCCWDSRNIYINRPEEEREEEIVRDLRLDVSLDDYLIVAAKARCTQLYETPMVRAFRAVKIQIDEISNYLATAKPVDGKNSNIQDIDKLITKLPDHIIAYEKIGESLKTEQHRIRGSKKIAYDQKTT